MKRYYNVLFVLFVFLSPLFVACESSGEEEEDLTTPYPVTCRISTREGTEIQGTENEGIRKLQLFVVKDGAIEASFSKNFDSNTETYEETVELTPGLKTVYTFANMDDINLNNIEDQTLKIDNGFVPGKDGKYIPMSNKMEINVTKLVGQKFTIELIRMISKVQLKFTNETGYEIVLQDIIMNPVTNSPVYVLPNKEFPDGTAHVSYTYPLKNYTLQTGNAPYSPDALYINETSVANDGWFTFQLNTLHGEEQRKDRFSISNTQVIERNSLLPINITLVDYKLELNVMSYPPIGGYPSVEVPMQDKEYHAHFPGGGPFIITPKLSKYSTGEAVTDDAVWIMEVSGDTSIFDLQPVQNRKNGEIIGTLKYASTNGKKALCTVKAEIEISPDIKRTLIYKVYIQNQ